MRKPMEQKKVVAEPGPQPWHHPRRRPQEVAAEEAPNHTGDAEWQPGGDPRDKM